MVKSDARRFLRISLNLPAKITVNTVDEYEGSLVNISPGDLALISDANVVQGDAVVVEIKGLDVIEGTVARTLPDGFAVSFLLSKGRRAKLTEHLMLRANAQFNKGLTDRRDALRHRGAPTRTVTRLADGVSLYVKIIDSSVDGVSVEAPRRPPIGSTIHIGRRRGIIVRHTPQGFVVVYEAWTRTAQEPSLRAV